MAKRKPAARARKPVATRTKPARAAGRKKAVPVRRAGKAAAKTAARKAAAKRVRTGAKKAKAAARKPVRKAAPKRTAAKAVKVAARRTAPKKPAPKKPAPRKAVASPAVPKKAAAARVARKVPALDRERRTIADVDAPAGPPSSLDLDRTASSVRSGRHEAAAHRKEVTQTGPDITAGDVDADWESAYAVGDEAPGGDNPTPDQDVVDEIGQALGMEYADDEELGGEGKLAGRDDDRWELDPESSEDFDERD
ncbi:MAG: DUF6335 family protein [Vicinamibacterales bacterium]